MLFIDIGEYTVSWLACRHPTTVTTTREFQLVGLFRHLTPPQQIPGSRELQL